AAGPFCLNEIIRGSRKRGLAHVFSLEMHSEFPMVFGAAHFTGEVPPLPDPTPLMLAEPCFIVELFPRLREAAGWHREPWRFERRRKEESLIRSEEHTSELQSHLK